MTNIGDFYLKFFSFLEVKFSIYLNRLVFVIVNLHESCMAELEFKLENPSQSAFYVNLYRAVIGPSG